MKKAIAKVPRKAPRQARSQATVETILEAAVRILDRDGIEAATTTNVAATAGVSIGTLYQYFADRDALIAALQEREFERALTLMGEVLSNANLTRAPRTTVVAVVRGLGELYASCPGLHRALVIESLRVTKTARVEAFDLRVIAIIRHFLTATGAEVRRTNVEAAAFVIFQAVRAVMLARLLERPAGLDERALSDELVDLVLRYLVADGPKAKAAPRKRVTASAR